MAYDEKTLKRDGSGITPVPQHFNPVADDYEAILGRNGASRVELYGPDGNPLIVTSGKLDVKATDAEAILTQIRGYVDGIEAALGEVQVTPTAYTVLARLKDLADRLGEVSASPTANTMLARLKNLEGYLDGVESALGTTADVEATGNGSLIAIVKRLRTLLAGGLPAALTAGGGMKVGVVDALPAGANIIGQVKLSDGTDALAVNTNGSINIVPINSAGTELFTDANPGSMQLTGSILGYDPNTETPVKLTAIEEGGNWYLATKSIDLVEEGEAL